MTLLKVLQRHLESKSNKAFTNWEEKLRDGKYEGNNVLRKIKKECVSWKSWHVLAAGDLTRNITERKSGGLRMGKSKRFSQPVILGLFRTKKNKQNKISPKIVVIMETGKSYKENPLKYFLFSKTFWIFILYAFTVA